MSVVLREPYQEYHNESEHVRWSAIMDYATSPEYYNCKYNLGRIQNDRSASLDFGSILDAAILEPETISSRVSVIPIDVLNADGHRKGKKWTDHKDANVGRYLVTQDEWDNYRWCIESVWANPACRDLLMDILDTQSSMYWHGKKCRFDARTTRGFFDLKTTKHTPDKFWKAVNEYRYDRQLAWYADGWSNHEGCLPETWWMVVHNEPPYESAVFYPSNDMMKDAAKENEDDFISLTLAIREGTWNNPKYQEPQELTMPWQTKKPLSC